MTVEEFVAQRRRMFGLAYRMLGSATDAEDVLQDAFLRWQGADRSEIRVPSAWLARVVTNLCLNRLTSARASRERYTGQWLPEPVLTGDGALGPMESAEQRDSVSLGLLLLQECLTPAERAVFVLREAFGYRHREVAAILGYSEANCRQLHARARRGLAADRPPGGSDRAGAERLLTRFLAAARDGDLAGLERLLAADVTSWADGGGNVSVARRPVVGPPRVARYLVGGFARFGGGMSVAEVNGTPAVLAWAPATAPGGTGARASVPLAGVLVPAVAAGRIVTLWTTANPDKLAFVARQAARLSRSTALPGLSG